MTSLFVTDATSKICPDCGRLFTPACIHGAEGEIARLREALDDSELTRAFEILDNYIENGTNPLVALGLIGKALLAWADVRKRALGAP